MAVAADRARPFRATRRGQLVEWQIEASDVYRGWIHVYGDSAISQLHSVLCTEALPVSARAQSLHHQTLRRIALGIEQQSSASRAGRVDRGSSSLRTA